MNSIQASRPESGGIDLASHIDLDPVHFGFNGSAQGVVQNHRNVLHYVRNYTNSLHICTDDRLHYFSPSARMRQRTILLTLCSMARYFTPSTSKGGPTRTTPGCVAINLRFTFCPTVFRLFVESLTADQRFPHLRVIKLMGEAVAKGDVELYRKYFSPECVLINRLGSTETGTIRWFFIDKKTPLYGNVVPVGYPVEDNEILLLDDKGREVQAESGGEITVESSYLTPGYWRKPELTAGVSCRRKRARESIALATWAAWDLRAAALSRTERLPNKNQRSAGRDRRDRNGSLNLGAIQAAVVRARKEPSDDYRLVAYLVAKEKPAPTVSKLRRALADTLPEHTIPAAFVVLDALPVAPNGKLDRKALPDPENCRPELDHLCRSEDCS